MLSCAQVTQKCAHFKQISSTSDCHLHISRPTQIIRRLCYLHVSGSAKISSDCCRPADIGVDVQTRFAVGFWNQQIGSAAPSSTCLRFSAPTWQTGREKERPKSGPGDRECTRYVHDNFMRAVDKETWHVEVKRVCGTLNSTGSCTRRQSET